MLSKWITYCGVFVLRNIINLQITKRCQNRMWHIRTLINSHLPWLSAGLPNRCSSIWLRGWWYMPIICVNLRPCIHAFSSLIRTLHWWVTLYTRVVWDSENLPCMCHTRAIHTSPKSLQTLSCKSEMIVDFLFVLGYCILQVESCAERYCFLHRRLSELINFAFSSDKIDPRRLADLV